MEFKDEIMPPLSHEDIAGKLNEIYKVISNHSGSYRFAWRNKELDFAVQQYLDLQACKGVASSDIQLAAASSNVIYEPSLFYRACSAARDVLISKLRATRDRQEADLLMQCLAMQADDLTLATLKELEEHPMSWGSQLYYKPSQYATLGNFSFEPSGKRLSLGFDTCYALEERNNDSAPPIEIAGKRAETCTDCGTHLIDLIKIDSSDKRLSFLPEGGIITATCCPNCLLGGDTYFSRYQHDGQSEALPYKGETEIFLSDKDVEKMHSKQFALSDKPVSVLYGTRETSVNTLGGFARWIQDFSYLTCPECGKTMSYFAQVHWSTLIENIEGTVFIEICLQCKITGMFHQQT